VGGAGEAELRRGIEGRVDRWSVHHGVEVGIGSAWHIGAGMEAVALSRAPGGIKGVTLGRMGHAG
jgi:hypothetical protein